MANIKTRKHPKAWDNVKKIWVTPEQVNTCEGHDRNRFFTDEFGVNEDKGQVLTLHNTSKTYTNKNGNEITRKAHFAIIAENTREYREQTAKKIIRQESLVHKLCKEVINDVKFIKVPAVSANILGVDTIVIHEQYIKVLNVNATECYDSTSGRIPDATLEVEILGKKQELFIEFAYKHVIDEQKRKNYTFHKKNCLEVNISRLQDNLDDSEKSLKNKIYKIISENAYWISNRYKQIIETDASEKYIVEISKKNGKLLNTMYKDKNDLYNRLFTFKDMITSSGIDVTHPCYFNGDPDIVYGEYDKCVNIGQCVNCNNCIWVEGYASGNTDNTAIYCRKDGKCEKIHPVKLVDMIIKYALSVV